MPRMVWVYLLSLGIVIGLLTVGAIRRDRGAVRCLSCVTPISARRRPLLGSRLLLGRWMCPHCGTEIDRVR